MPEHPHLILPRANINIDRRKKPGYGSRPARDYVAHTDLVRNAVEEVIAHRQQQIAAGEINPSLIVRIRTVGVIPNEEWERIGLVVLGTNDDQSVILFSSDNDLQEFQRRLNEYARGIPEGQVNPQYNNLFAAIEEIGVLRPIDRIGSRLISNGITTSDDFIEEQEYRLDVELWDFDNQINRGFRINEIEARVVEKGGSITDRYIGKYLTIFRIVGTGLIIRSLLNNDDVRMVDLPPSPDDTTSDLLELTIQDFPDVPEPHENAPSIGIIDSGITTAHPFLRSAMRTAIGIPAALGFNDLKGHGTNVAGIALYGNVQTCVDNRSFIPTLTIHSVKVVNDQGRFDDILLIHSQMRQAVEVLSEAGCRIINISLGDPKNIYANGKIGSWAAVLDELCREFNIVIVVSTGNYKHLPTDGNHDSHLTDYPSYLLKPKSRLLEPATAVIPLTVGSISHSDSIPANAVGNVGIQPVAGIDEPSPFTRSGPSIGRVMKPDLCDYGGNLIFDGVTQGVKHIDQGSILTLNHNYLTRLLKATIGTSIAAPAVAFKAAQVLATFPTASANLIRALLASSASIPKATEDRILQAGLNTDALRNVCGFGIANLGKAITSDDNRVVLYADSTIGLDKFYVYEIPIPTEFSTTAGKRNIQVTLAFDPPTRYTRVDYLGTRMSFRLIRGRSLESVIEHYRQRSVDDGPIPDMDSKYDCKFEPKVTIRDRGTLQKGIFTMARNPDPAYGETYYLAVRCEKKWSTENSEPQRFAVVVEMSH